MKKKIFIGTIEIAGYYKNLSRGFQENHVKCDFVSYTLNKMSYDGDTKYPKLLKLYKKLAPFNNKSVVTKILFNFSKILVFIWVLKTLINYDIFIFGFGRSLLPNNIDLPILKLFGKTVIVNLGHGSEIRPPYLNGAITKTIHKTLTIDGLYNLTKIKKHKASYIEKYADYIIGAPYSSSQFLSKRFINWFALGIPFAIDYKTKCINKYTNILDEPNKVRILHSPSDPIAKGTGIIRDTLEALRKKDYDFEYIEITNAPNIKVLEELEKCDFVIDEIYSDTPMAGLATEAAWYYKPTIVTGYGLKKLNDYVPKGMFPPSISVEPQDLELAITKLIDDKDFRKDVGKKAQKFVLEKWNRKLVANRYLKIVENQIPKEWWIDPTDINYIWGWGQSKQKTIDSIKLLLDNFGENCLELNHKPLLKNAILNMVNFKKK